MKHTFFALLVALFFCTGMWQDVAAQPNMGGEIRWECTSQGNYRFVVTRYRDCRAINLQSTIQLTTDVPGFSTIQLTRTEIRELTPGCGCPNGGTLSCSTPSVLPAINGVVQAHIYTSDVQYPNGVPLTGVPPATGWAFTNSDCCRALGSNLHEPWWMEVVARMYPYEGNSVGTCYDNAPVFTELPSPVYCAGDTVWLNHHAFDPDGDSLTYELIPVIGGNFSAGYSYTSPFPGTLQHPGNKPLTQLGGTGMFWLKSNTTGRYNHAVKVTVYRNGVKIAEVMREFMTAITSCDPTNTPPAFSVALQSVPGQPGMFTDTVTAGDSIHFSLGALDFSYCAGTSGTVPQTVSLQAFGEMLSAPMNPVGCPNPPCATLTPSTDNDTPLTSAFAISTLFSWQTGCNHLLTMPGGQLARAREHDFVFRVTDSHCPVPGVRYAKVRLVVLPFPRLESPVVRCVSVQPNGDVLLNWEPVADTLNSFNGYHLWHAIHPEGPFTKVDSIFDITIGQYLHVGAGTLPGYYLVTTRSGCGGAEMMPPADTVRTIALQANYPGQQGASFTLKWNNPVQPLQSSGSERYEVWRKIGSGAWTLMGLTTNTTWHDMQPLCSDTVAYRIELVDTANPAACRSISNVVAGFFENILPPQEPTPHLVTVDEATGQSHFSWFKAKDDDAAGYWVTAFMGGVLLATDTIWDLSDTTWTDLYLNPCAAAITYRVSTFDVCGNVSAPSQTHNTILPVVQYDKDQNTNHITWNPYPGLVSGTGSGYSVWYSVNGGPSTYLTTASPQVNYCIHANITPGDTICYKVLAYGAAQQLWSRSCEVCADVPTSIAAAEPLLFTVGQNIPNPATGQTLIPFTVPEAGKVELSITSLTGQIVWQEEMQTVPGKHHFTLHSDAMPQGVYLYTVQYQGAQQTRKMTVR